MAGIRKMVHDTVPTPSKYEAFNKCERKLRFDSEEEAANAVKSLQSASYYKASKNNRPLEPYQCDHCHLFHFGHRPSYLDKKIDNVQKV